MDGIGLRSLQLSSARTLARKHKSTVRTFIQRLGSVFLEEFFTEEEQVFSLMFTKTKTIHFSFHGSQSERIWALFSCKKICKIFQHSPSHQIFRRVHEALNIDKNKTNYTV
jgi:hypothetical protein